MVIDEQNINSGNTNVIDDDTPNNSLGANVTADNPAGNVFKIGDKTINQLYPLLSYVSHDSYDCLVYSANGVDTPLYLNHYYNGDTWVTKDTITCFQSKVVNGVTKTEPVTLETIKAGNRPCFRDGTSNNYMYMARWGGRKGDSDVSAPGQSAETIGIKMYIDSTNSEDPTLFLKYENGAVMFQRRASQFREGVIPEKIIFLLVGGGGAGHIDYSGQGGSAGCWAIGILNLTPLKRSGDYYMITAGGGGYWYCRTDVPGYEEYWVEIAPKASVISYTYFNSSGPNYVQLVSVGPGNNGVNSHSMNETTSSVTINGTYACLLASGKGASGGYGNNAGQSTKAGANQSAVTAYATYYTPDRSDSKNYKALGNYKGGGSRGNWGGGGGGASIGAPGGEGGAGYGGSTLPTPGENGSGGGGTGLGHVDYYNGNGGQGLVMLFD